MEKNKSKMDKKTKSFWDWVLWWRIEKEEMQKQTEQYNNLRFYQSARGISFLLLIFSSLLTTAFVIFGDLDKTSFFDVFLLLIISFFIYKGYLWAMIIAMAYWTFSKIYSIFDNPSTWFMQVLFWVIYMHAFYLAFQVERTRKRQMTAQKFNLTKFRQRMIWSGIIIPSIAVSGLIVMFIISGFTFEGYEQFEGSDTAMGTLGILLILFVLGLVMLIVGAGVFLYQKICPKTKDNY